MLAETVDGLLNGRVELVFHAVEVFAVDGGFDVAARGVLEFLQQAMALLILEFEVAQGEGDEHLDGAGIDGGDGGLPQLVRLRRGLDTHCSLGIVKVNLPGVQP